jgi:hypothetical protein
MISEPDSEQTEHVDLGRFWPFFAYLSEMCRIDPARPLHPAIMRKIVNNPIPNDDFEIVNGVATNPVVLGEPIRMDQMIGRAWWPSAISDQMRRELFWRIMREGHSVQVLLSILISLMAEMYTTNHDPEKAPTKDPAEEQFSHNKRFRLQSGSNAVIDFGICKGEADVKEGDTLGYFTDFPRDPTKFIRGQDPKDHYWIYFKTIREEFTLDLCMFTFNFGLCVRATQYQPHHFPGAPEINDVGAFFLTREYRRDTPKLQWETERFSVLQNEELWNTVRTRNFREADTGALISFMDLVTSRPSTRQEQCFLISWTTKHRRMLASNLYHKEYLQYPPTPPVGINYDPGQEERIRPPEDEEEAFITYIRKKTRLARKGKIGADELVENLRAWNTFSPEEKRGKGSQKKTK